ncbi:MAG TPA: hypothetical protein VL171_18425 [Verrucomicrobiae bacterium]|nr:hypothetical protein [Verrucomicrobiae bacterium]
MRRSQAKRVSSDYDGHTEFDRLTPEQRLMWLSQAAQFVVAARQSGRADHVKVVGNRIAETPAEYLVQLCQLRRRIDRWNPYPRPRGQVFKFRTWEDLEKWRQSQTNPRLR